MFWYIFERLTTSFGVPMMDDDMLLLSAARRVKHKLFKARGQGL